MRQLSQTDRKLIEQSDDLADVHTPEEMRDFLASISSPFADTTDLGTLYAACFGLAQANLRVLTSLISETVNG